MTDGNDTPQGEPLTPAAADLLHRAALEILAGIKAGHAQHDFPDNIDFTKMAEKDEIEIMLAINRDSARRCRDAIAVSLRRALVALLEKNAPKLEAPLVDALADWIDKDANPEALAEWLERGGWEKVDGAKVEAGLATPESARIGKDPCFRVIWPSHDAPYCVLWYDAPRADADKPDVKAFIARHSKPAPLPWFNAGATPPEKATVLLGLDALKAAIASHEWQLLPQHLNKDWLRPLAVEWMDARRAGIAERTAAQARALPLAIQSRNIIKARQTTGDAFLRFPSLLKDAGAWTGALVEVDGAAFAQEPDLAAAPVRKITDAEGNPLTLFKPRAWEIAAAGRLEGPRQLVLPGLPTDPKHSPDLGAFMAVNATGAAVLDRLPGLCAKLLPLVFAMCPLDGTPVKGPVKDLVKLLYPDWKARRQMAGDVERVGAAVVALRALRLVEALPGGGLRVYPVLSGGYFDLAAGADAEACFTLNDSLGDLATTKKGKAAFMLVNLSRLMDLDAKSPDRIAVALRLAAYWHTCKQRGQWMPDRLDFLPVDDLLVTINAPGAVADVLAGADLGKAGTVQLSKARARLMDETLPALVEAGLVGELETRRPGQYRGKTKGESWQVKAAPPLDWMEASRRAAPIRTPPGK